MNAGTGLLTACLFAMAASACSSTPSPNLPHCGPAIEQTDVMVGDLRHLKNQEDKIPAYLETELGSYTVMSEDPVLIAKTGNHKTVFESTGLATMKASKSGCNLVLVLDEAGLPSMSERSTGRQAYWAVVFGTYQPSAPGEQDQQSKVY